MSKIKKNKKRVEDETMILIMLINLMMRNTMINLHRVLHIQQSAEHQIKTMTQKRKNKRRR